MIPELEGSIMEAFNSDSVDFVLQLVNCTGKLHPESVAAQLCRKLPFLYTGYREYCDTHRIKDIIGTIQLYAYPANLFSRRTRDITVVNMFTHDHYCDAPDHVREKYLPCEFTDCLKQFECTACRRYFNKNGRYPVVAMPYHIGCSKYGGGDWDLDVRWVLRSYLLKGIRIRCYRLSNTTETQTDNNQED